MKKTSGDQRTSTRRDGKDGGGASTREASPLLKPAQARKLDAVFAAGLSKMVGNLPPQELALAWLDWAAHLALAPGKQLEIIEQALRDAGQLARDVVRGMQPPSEARYAGDGWNKRPFALLARVSHAGKRLWHTATEDVPGLARGHAALTRFYGQQLLEVLSPDHWPLTNPEVLNAIRHTRARNLLAGGRNLRNDIVDGLRRRKRDTDTFRVGENLAVTPGKVIFRNRLIELIQYSPTTATVHPEPVLIVPAWIMKYYILDLQAQNSMVRWLVSQGHTVFMISWKNPDKDDRDLAMDDYRTLGALAALDAINAVLPNRKVHSVGYCVGGTLLSITAAAMARDGDDRLKTITLFAAQTDFADPGELGLFINASTLHWLDAQMQMRGYLAASQMAGAFAALRAHDLVWAPLLRRYWLGETPRGIDIMAWNSDATRMPFRMHSDYLRELYLENRLAQNRYRVSGRAVSIGDIRVPLFVVGTVTDHVAPWLSVYKVRKLKRLGETTFVLTNGGHNAGIVSEPGRPRRHYRIGGWDERSDYQAPEEWAATATVEDGSWWPAWGKWLAGHSAARRVKPPSMGTEDAYAPLCDAPGTYILQR